MRRGIGLIAVVALGLASPAGAEDCASVAGDWTWSTGLSIRFTASRTAVVNGSQVGTWECTDPKRNAVTVRWSNGFVDTIEFQGDRAAATNQLGIRTTGARAAARPAPSPPAAPPSAPRPPAAASAPGAAGLDPALLTRTPARIDPAVDAIYQRADAAYKARDYAGALPGMREAARRGSPKAQNVLGMMYEDGNGVAKDVAQARVLYEQSARQGYRAAQFALGLLYEGGAGKPKNSAWAAALIRAAADQKLGAAEAELGMLYELGEGVPRDRGQAVYWLRMAGSQGDGRAQWIADWLSDPSTPHFADELQLATYIDRQVAAYYRSQMPPTVPIPRSTTECKQTMAGVVWQTTCEQLRRSGL
jgi:hypothetical protein